MATTRQLTAIIEREDDGYVALCPELDSASQGDTIAIAWMGFVSSCLRRGWEEPLME